MTSRADRRRTKAAPSVRVEAQHRKFFHRTASPQERVVAPSEQEMRRSIENGECPFCGSSYKNIALHTVRTHGVGRDELKAMAGIPKTISVCTPELSDRCSERNRRAMEAGDDRVQKMRAARDPQGKRSLSAAAVKQQRLNGAKGTAVQVARAGVHDAEIIDRVRSGETLRVIAGTLGLSESQVRRSLKRQGFTEDLRSTNSGRRQQRI